MKKNILFLLTLVTTLSACSTFEGEEHRNPEATPVEVQTEGTSDLTVEQDVDNGVYMTLDMSQGESTLSGASLVDTIPEINIAIYEVGEDQYVEPKESLQIDERVYLSNEEGLAIENELWQLLAGEIDLIIGTIGHIPEELQQVCDANGNKIVVFQEAVDSLYGTEIAQGIIEAAETDVDYLLLPLHAEDASDAVVAAVAIALEKGIPVFDRMGVRL
ncbi:MAG: hypothetical protein VX278_13115 [Myxococcota bacterium]|nr:hypothetical protein [Myxococcota bacterium]